MATGWSSIAAFFGFDAVAAEGTGEYRRFAEFFAHYAAGRVSIDDMGSGKSRRQRGRYLV
jgi:hypothetical protein